MSDERDTQAAGAPVEEAEATTTEVRAAVDRAVAAESNETGSEVADPGPIGTDAVPAEPPATEPFTPVERTEAERPLIALSEELPSAGPAPEPVVETEAPRVPEGKVLVSADHPIAALYMQTPMPPELRGNRGAGVLISLLATLAFALVHAGVIALWLAPSTPPSAFLEELLRAGLWPVVAASVAFFIGLALLVLIVGRAGWWAYVLGGFLVGALVWIGALAGAALTAYQANGAVGLVELIGGDPAAGIDAIDVIRHFGLELPVIGAAIAAREVTVWFGAWIGSRGRKLKRLNAEAIAEYEAALAEVQAK
ncbi:hypothetical protein J4H92_10335 [Leucobacter weissii]|uniref:Uncharacterized protein n=1 Tax=Leucobacter weissii TaxID=1983706 RepID=A0A939MJX5_9MICO|nr:hypothetical protein [Leucobacter weissii]MBO1902343.1 hypothetical protein [Leucobacter weissii]